MDELLERASGDSRTFGLRGALTDGE